MKNITRVFPLCFLLLWAVPMMADDQGEMIQPVDVYTRSAKIALATNPPEYQRALRNLHIAREHYPDNYQVHFLLGSIWADKDEIDSMVASFALAKEYSTEKEWKKVAKDLDKVIEGKWLERFNRAVTLVNQSDSTEEHIATIDDTGIADSMRWVLGEIRRMAKEALRHCVILKPSDFRAFTTRGLIYQREGLVDSSLIDLASAESLFHRFEFEDSITNYYDTSAFFSGPEGKPTKLFKEYEKKYKKLSDDKKTRYHNLLVSLIGVYYDSEAWTKALIVGRRFYGLEPDDINNIVTLADLFSRLDQDAEALKWQEAVVNRDPGSKDTWYNMGIFYYNTAVRLQDSVVRYESQVENNPDDVAAAEGLTEFSRKRLDNLYKAIPRFAKVVEIDENDDDTWRLLAICSFSLASLADDLQASDRIETVEEVVGTNSYDRESFWGEAEVKLRKATDLFPDDEKLCRMMKVTLAQLRKIDELNVWNQRCP